MLNLRILSEVEFILNSCPLLPLNDGINDLDTLKTKHLLPACSLYISNQIFNVKKLIVE